MGNRDYFIGLDMGTNSVGWAVTNPQYELLKAKGKDLWGIREFDSAEGAVERRTHRVSRRNHQRSQVRIGLLKSYFEEAISAEDPDFYLRLENSFYDKEDKDDALRTKYAIFSDADYTDTDYYRDYPTIFHLKEQLIKDTVPVDRQYTRKLYLALLNYFKHRGHFLNQSLSGEAGGSKDIIAAMDELFMLLQESFDIRISYGENQVNDIREVFSNTNMSRTKRKEALMDILGVVKKDTSKYLILCAIVGLKADLVKLLGIESDQKAELEFSSAGFEEKLPEIYSVIGEEYAELIEGMKQVYDAGVLSAIMNGVDWLSEARVRDYEKHKADLKLLKQCIRKYCGEEEYNYLFRENEDGTYSAYIGSVNSDGKMRRGEKLSASKSGERYTNLKKRIKKDLDAYSADENVAYIIEELEKESFLPKQLTFANGVIPNQLHEREVRRILENASKNLDFLNVKDETGLTVSEKIVRLFTFQVPYFVGPVSQNYKGNGWAVRKPGMEKEPVYPWNIEEVIDYSATSEEFITRMVRECTYISGECALPKESMEYQAFMVLNTINSLKIRDEKISVELKQDIYRDLFEESNKISKKKILNYINKRGYGVSEDELTGVDTILGCQLSTYRKFKDVFGEDIKKDAVQAMVEQIVFWGTVYGDSKKMLKQQILKNYGDWIKDKQLERILGYKYRDWGRLSKEFLELSGCNKETGEITSLIRALWEDNLNLMELLHSDKYTFAEALNEKHKAGLKTLSEFTFDDLDGMYFSAPVKRMIWQTLLIIREIQKIMGCPPKRIFVEMARSEEELKGEAGRKDSREKELLELYKSIKEDRSWDKEIKEAGVSGQLRSKKLYLYYKQMGRDMYTGLPIDLAELFDDNKYDIDHIYPRHFVKDDSIHNNLVLVDKRKNSRKSDTYPIDINIRSNSSVISLWKLLRDKGFMNEEKYRRLTGTNPFSEEQKAGFIARQMVETNQATKGVNDLLKELMPDGTVLVYSKARNVSDFRNEFGFYKSRTINDFHHAHDAYFNIVVGNVYYTKFTMNPLNFIREGRADYHLGKMFHKDVERNGYVAWSAPVWDSQNQKKMIADGESLSVIKRVMGKNSPLMTRLNTTQKGAISDATICGAYKAKQEGYLPIKGTDNRLSNVSKYGGFNSIKNAYFFLVEHEVEGKGKDKGKYVKTRTIECLPVYKRVQVERDPEGLYQYCLELGLRNPSVRVKKIKPQSLLLVDGLPMYITGKKNDRYIVRNACNLVLTSKWTEYIHYIDKYNQTKVISDNITVAANIQLYEELQYKHCVGIYKNRPAAVSEILNGGKDKFKALDIEKQIYVLTQILNLSLICNSANADLRLIGGSQASGSAAISKNIMKYSNVVLVNQSVTGVYEKKVDLLTV